MITVENTTDEIVQILEKGTLTLEGLIPWGSNYTFLASLCYESVETKAIYKPRKGERPLWDFARGTLHQRERAAFLLSNALGWNLVPPTVVRDGPHGQGSVQYFVEHDADNHYFTFEGKYMLQVQQIVLFDAIINNADRKSGHVLLDNNGRLWAIDHGVCFHSDPKLRTVIWEYAAVTIPDSCLRAMETLQTALVSCHEPLWSDLNRLLSAVEITALQQRLANLIGAGAFPEPGPGRHYPWPMV
jgi:hypothetical protein